MKLTELRVGNYIASDVGDYKQVIEIRRPNHIRCLYRIEDMVELKQSLIDIDYLEPIDLTDEMLSKFGFEKALNGWWCKNEIISYEDGFIGIGVDRETSISYVHQLQNYYFAVMGEELHGVLVL